VITDHKTDVIDIPRRRIVPIVGFPEIIDRMAKELKAWRLSVENGLIGADYANKD
jgi:hypothetical protein